MSSFDDNYLDESIKSRIKPAKKVLGLFCDICAEILYRMIKVEVVKVPLERGNLQGGSERREHRRSDSLICTY